MGQLLTKTKLETNTEKCDQLRRKLKENFKETAKR